MIPPATRHRPFDERFAPCLIRLAALLRHNLLLVRREPGPQISRLVMPLVLLAVLQPLYRTVGTTAEAATGMMVMFAMLAVSVIGSGILVERLWRTWTRLHATPARPAEILLAKALPAYALLLLQQALVVAFAVAVFGMPLRHPVLLAAAIAVWCAVLLCVGALLGSLVRSPAALSSVQDIVGLLCTAVGGALVPLTVLPHWVRAAAPASPGYWAVGMLRSALAGSPGATGRDAAVLGALGVVAAVLAGRRLTWSRTHV
ncbi:hypothetical protein BIV57_07365 [Mangrovactinospora gilvigrisea]|uniref:Transport permease protein n=1 Tax=Mangrovactinospora gilvigrisea TaxID=1428644 RepID=A0A1J7BXB8_9ACTN|nr:ABC transporter permease [Mangrovactinospora gilvigrisea]OIV38129.1 hypothetical protein BIV57_07365 [Mangrovactinospora gilvigrisea]